MGWEQIGYLAIKAQNIEHRTPNIEHRRRTVERTPLLHRLRKRGDRIHAGRAHSQTLLFQQSSRGMPSLPRAWHATGHRSRADDFLSAQNLGRGSNHTVATRHEAHARLL